MEITTISDRAKVLAKSEFGGTNFTSLSAFGSSFTEEAATEGALLLAGGGPSLVVPNTILITPLAVGDVDSTFQFQVWGVRRIRQAGAADKTSKVFRRLLAQFECTVGDETGDNDDEVQGADSNFRFCKAVSIQYPTNNNKITVFQTSPADDSITLSHAVVAIDLQGEPLLRFVVKNGSTSGANFIVSGY